MKINKHLIPFYVVLFSILALTGSKKVGSCKTNQEIEKGRKKTRQFYYLHNLWEFVAKNDDDTFEI